MITSEEEVVLSETEFKELRQYSCTLPTGTTVGKQWKRNENAYGPTRGPEPDWWMGEYIDHEDPERIGIHWRRIIHKCRREDCDLPTWDGCPGVHCGPHLFEAGEV